MLKERKKIYVYILMGHYIVYICAYMLMDDYMFFYCIFVCMIHFLELKIVRKWVLCK